MAPDIIGILTALWCAFTGGLAIATGVFLLYTYGHAIAEIRAAVTNHNTGAAGLTLGRLIGGKRLGAILIIAGTLCLLAAPAAVDLISPLWILWGLGFTVLSASTLALWLAADVRRRLGAAT